MKTDRNILKKSATMLALIVSAAFLFEACAKEPVEGIGRITMTTKATTVRLGMVGTEDVTVDWGDGKISNANDAFPEDNTFTFTHDYSEATTHNIVITGGNVTKLYCGGNGLTALDVSRVTMLTNLVCSNNQLTTLDVSKNTALNDLECDNNQLTGLNVSPKGTLWFLSCVSNQLTAVALNDMFGSLPNWKTRTEKYGGTIYISYRSEGPVYGNPGNPDCDRSIATKKGWDFRSAR